MKVVKAIYFEGVVCFVTRKINFISKNEKIERPILLEKLSVRNK